MVVKNPHDALVKHTFSQPGYAAELLRSTLPDGLVATLDFNTLKPCPGSFIDDALRDSHTDLLFSASIDNEGTKDGDDDGDDDGTDKAYLYLLVEHQSTVDTWMPARIWWSVGDIWRQHIKNNPEPARSPDPLSSRLPLVIPMVLHHSGTGWTAATCIGQLLAMTPTIRRALGEHMPRLGFYLDDLGANADEQLMTRSMAALPRLALWVLKNARSDIDLIAEMSTWRAVFIDVLAADSGVHALSVILRYILQVNKAEPDALEAFVTELGQDAREAFMTGAQILEQRVERQERRRILQAQLSQRFGELPRAVRTRLAQADPDELQRWLERVIAADTLDDVLS